MENKNFVEELTDTELEQISGAKGMGWVHTLTDDCPNSVFVCC